MSNSKTIAVKRKHRKARERMKAKIRAERAKARHKPA